MDFYPHEAPYLTGRRGDEPTVVPDTKLDWRFAKNVSIVSPHETLPRSSDECGIAPGYWISERPVLCWGSVENLRWIQYWQVICVSISLMRG
jgi:hypothetical protein